MNQPTESQEVPNKTPYTLIYAHDPMCSWCWGFAPTWDALVAELTTTYPELKIQKLLGGLAPDSDEPMPQEMREYLQNTWHTIKTRIPGTQFNFDYWTTNTPKRSTWPACRAVIAARQQGEHYGDQMSRAIQIAYYTKAQNPSERQILINLASDLGLDTDQFSQAIDADDTKQQHQKEMQQTAQYGIQGFPSLVLIGEQHGYRITIDYTDPKKILAQIEQALSTENP